LDGVNTPHFSLHKAVLSKQPNGVSPILPSEGCACNITFLWFGSGFFRGDHSPTATSAPSLRLAHPERFPDKFSVCLGYHNHPKISSFFSSLFSNIIILSFFSFHSLSLSTVDITPGVASVSTYPALTPYAFSFFFSFRRGPTPPQGPFPYSL
jgi:hypothetical protein